MLVLLAHWHLLTEKLKNIQNSLCTLKFLLSWNRQEFRDLEISRWVGVITWAMIAHLHFDFWIPSSINLLISVLYKTSRPPNLRRLLRPHIDQYGCVDIIINTLASHHTQQIYDKFSIKRFWFLIHNMYQQNMQIWTWLGSTTCIFLTKNRILHLKEARMWYFWIFPSFLRFEAI